ncbi:MAG: hydroxymethylbilane synthase [Pseudomonadota bacterium]
MSSLRIATRRSELALWQAHYVQDALATAHPDLATDLLPMTTQGDEMLSQSLAEIGGKGLFLKELEVALVEERAQIAVHSMKDVPADLPDGMTICAVLERADPRDAFVSLKHERFADLPEAARLGTSSLRRRVQLLAKRPDLQIGTLRGNLQTRLSKLESEQWDAIVLAVAGLERLGLGARITDAFDIETSLPAIGQGAVGIECREADARVIELMATINHVPTATCVAAERALNMALEGNCHSPIAGFATLADDGELTLRGRVGALDGSRLLEASASSRGDPKALGHEVAEALLAQGAAKLVAAPSA